MMQKTPVFKSFISSAMDSSQTWRLAGSVLVCLFCWVLFTKFVKLLLFSNATISELILGNTKTGMIFILLSFWGLLLGTFLITKLHKRPFKSLFGTRYHFKKYFSITFVLCFLFGFISTFLTIALGKNELIYNLNYLPWIKYLIWGLPLLFVQVVAEEIFFRGYLVQQLAAKYESFLVWMILPSLVFGFLHYDPVAYGSSSLLIVGLLTGYGIFSIDLTRRTGNLGAAIGFHFANNIFALFILGNASKMSGLSLFILPIDFENFEELTLIVTTEFLALVAIWFVLARVFRGL
jgi:hypothetical protein